MKRMFTRMIVGLVCAASTLVSRAALAEDCPLDGGFWTTGEWHGCVCPAGYHKKYTAPFNARAVCEEDVTVAPTTECNITCASPPPGCAYEGQVLSGACDEVTCGTLVCDPSDPAVAPDGVAVVSIEGQGAGCPSGSISPLISEDRRALALYLSDMELQHPPGNAYQRIQCAARVTLHVPEQWQFRVATIDTRGYAHLPAGAWLRRTANSFFDGAPLGAAVRARIDGPYDDLYLFTDTYPSEAAAWSACGQDAILALNEALELQAPSDPSLWASVNVDSMETHSRIVRWQWRRC